MEGYQSQFNVLILVIMLMAFFVSSKSPNVRWLIGVACLIKIIDVLLYKTITQWGYGYYFVISGYDIAGILCIVKRKQIAATVGTFNFPWISPLACSSEKFYKLTSNEVGIVIIYVLSLLVNMASIIERAVRKTTDFYPLFVYNSFPVIKFALSIMMLMIFFSVSINGARGIYNDYNKV